MDILSLIMNRRSIRRFDPRDVPEEAIEKILTAIQWAPSWANVQCWEVVVVRDLPTKLKIQETMGKENPATKGVVEAPVLLVICGKLKTSGYYKGEAKTKFGDWLLFDLGLATQNACLIAHALGLGTVILGLFDHDQVNAILGVPDDYEVVTILPLGYPAKESKAPKRREISEFVHKERF
jgi:nitroreductase